MQLRKHGTRLASIVLTVERGVAGVVSEEGRRIEVGRRVRRGVDRACRNEAALPMLLTDSRREWPADDPLPYRIETKSPVPGLGVEANVGMRPVERAPETHEFGTVELVGGANAFIVIPLRLVRDCGGGNSLR